MWVANCIGVMTYSLLNIMVGYILYTGIKEVSFVTGPKSKLNVIFLCRSVTGNVSCGSTLKSLLSVSSLWLS